MVCHWISGSRRFERSQCVLQESGSPRRPHDTWRWSNHHRSKRREPFTQRHVTYQRPEVSAKRLWEPV